MGFALSHYCCFLCFIVLLPLLCKCEDTFTYSRATYYGSPDCLGTPTGACGFGEYGRRVNGGNVGAVSRLYRNGTGCGACYQVRCKVPNLCADNGMKVVVTDHGEGDYTDFILSPRGFSMLARPNMAADLFAYGVVGIEYRRVPCQYPGSNIFFKVHEHSRFPDYLAIVMLYQAGLSDITAVAIWQEDCQEWKGMRKSYGAVWDMANPPKGPVSLRFQVSGRGGQKWVQLMNVIPSDWKPGVAYVKSPIFTLCIGNAWGEAALLLAAGAKGNRSALPSSTIIIKQVKLYAKPMGKSPEQIEADIRRPKYFSPSDAVEYGIIDKVLYNERSSEDRGVVADLKKAQLI